MAVDVNEGILEQKPAKVEIDESIDSAVSSIINKYKLNSPGKFTSHFAQRVPEPEISTAPIEQNILEW